jgi:hypothetical protein
MLTSAWVYLLCLQYTADHFVVKTTPRQKTHLPGALLGAAGDHTKFFLPHGMGSVVFGVMELLSSLAGQAQAMLSQLLLDTQAAKFGGTNVHTAFHKTRIAQVAALLKPGQDGLDLKLWAAGVSAGIF